MANGVSAAPAAPARILVVDDSTVIRLAIKKMLSTDFDVAVAGDGEAGWDALLADDQIKCLITDIEMPGLDGYAFICRARAAEIARIRDMPIIAITGAEDEQTKMRAYACGATDFITKPLDKAQLQSRIHAYVKQDEPAAAPVAGAPEHDEDTGTDPVTQLHSRRYFLSHGEKDLARCKDQDLSVVRVDIDNFKALYRRHGDDAVDQILIHIAKILSGIARPEDTVARVGGAEFALLLPGTTRAQAAALCRRFAETIAKEPVAFNGEGIAVTASVGVAALGVDKRESIPELLALAEQRLGHAKAEGGNRVSVGVLGEAVEPEEFTLAAPSDALPDFSLELGLSLGTPDVSFEPESVQFEPIAFDGQEALPDIQLDTPAPFLSGSALPAGLVSVDKALQAIARGEKEQLSRYLLTLVGEILPLIEAYKPELPEDLQACADRLIDAIRRAQ